LTEDTEKVLGNAALDDGFATPDAGAGDTGEVRERLRPLKELMLSLEWEISRDTLAAVENELAKLGHDRRHDAVVTGLCRILHALARYLAAAGAKAHPAAVKFFFGVYNGLEKVLLTPSLSAAKRKKLLVVALQRYNLVRKRISAAKKEAAAAEEAPRPATSTPPDTGEPVVPVQETPPQPVVSLVEEVEVTPLAVEKEEAPPAAATEDDISRRLDAFFGEHETVGTSADGVVRLAEIEPEPGAHGVVPLEEVGEPQPSGPGEAKPSADLVETVAARLDSFFDREEGAEGDAGDDVVRLGEIEPPAAAAPIPPADEDLAERLREFFSQTPPPAAPPLADDLEAAARSAASLVGTCLLLLRSLVIVARHLDADGLARCRTLADEVTGYLDRRPTGSAAPDVAGLVDIVRRYIRFQDEVVLPLVGRGGGGFVIEDVFIP